MCLRGKEALNALIEGGKNFLLLVKKARLGLKHEMDGTLEKK